ncbi:type 2 lanthipeptide synthetase LanM family protein [Gordonia rubripertincta]|uniref:Type 2 lanthipeptide synthetase LanM family protein n=1 Tax=Gordonia rubripertincta TaxID=36822 RepID=A0ABT4MRZ6_GORRU|nr:type 2 lanthipeptide synthetase LanM family protein [Gordonia rubripertincta]MCZ4549752.1 type 2 lanthipeptide synthetase LanM family protein [Gordonia rubripertincta]
MTADLQVYPELTAEETRELLEPLAQFDDRLDAALSHDTFHSFPPVLGSPAPQHESRPFQSIVRVLVEPERAETEEALAAHGHSPRQQLIEEWASSLEAALYEVYVRVLVRHLSTVSAANGLDGETPEERYQSYVSDFGNSVLEELHRDHPMLERIHRSHVTTRRRALVEMLNRVHRHRADLEGRLSIPADAEIAAVDLGRGDTHAGGRSVAVITFDGGMKVVYKPRPVDCEAGYAELVDWCAERGIVLPAAEVVRCDGYGFVEFITAVDVDDSDRNAFMDASGQLACVLYLLNARDMHHENVIADHRGPVPVDLETLMHPPRNRSGGIPEVPRNAHEILRTSIYGVGLLPLVLVREDASGGYDQIDLGFLGADEEGRSPFSALTFTNAFRDDMAVVLSRPDKEGLRASTVRGHSRADVLQLADAMAAGFRRAYEAISAEAAEFEAVVIRTFNRAKVRYVHNPTATYAQLLRTTTSPEALASPELSALLLKRLVIANRYCAPELTATEVTQMVSRDVPYLLVDATGTEVRDAEGNPAGATVPASPLGTVVDKIRGLGDSDLAQQIDLIYAAFTARFPDNHLEADSPAPVPTLRRDEGLPDVARRLGDQFTESMLSDLFGHLPTTWLSPLASMQTRRAWPPGVLGYDLYSGRMGPALALATLGTVLDQKRFHTAAARVFDPMAGILTDQSYEDRSLSAIGAGAYTGLSGCLFALAAAGEVAGRADWITAARASIPEVVARASAGASLGAIDVIRGRIGIASALRAVAGDHRQSFAMVDGVARDAVDEIRVAMQVPRDERDQVLRQSGFAHGIAGLVFHLTALASDGFGGGDAQPLARDLFDELPQFFSPEQGNWRTSFDEPHHSTGWCHGVSGMALALNEFAASEAAVGNRATEFTARAIDTLQQHGFSRNLTLCHGDLGNWEVVQRVGSEAQTREVAELLTAQVVGAKSHDRHSRHANTASLMVGTAGVAYHLARRLEPDLPYSPLTLKIGGAA